MLAEIVEHRADQPVLAAEMPMDQSVVDVASAPRCPGWRSPRVRARQTGRRRTSVPPQLPLPCRVARRRAASRCLREL